MPDLKWTPLAKPFAPSPGDISVPWILVPEDFASSVSYLKFVVTGSWTAVSGMADCGPDGLFAQNIPADQLILADCAMGALIGRIGGSSANVKVTDPPAGGSKPFAIGSCAIVKLPDGFVGPLFLGQAARAARRAQREHAPGRHAAASRGTPPRADRTRPWSRSDGRSHGSDHPMRDMLGEILLRCAESTRQHDDQWERDPISYDGLNAAIAAGNLLLSGVNLDDIHAQVGSSGVVSFLHDGLGSTVALTNNSGAIAASMCTRHTATAWEAQESRNASAIHGSGKRLGYGSLLLPRALLCPAARPIHQRGSRGTGRRS